MKRWLLLGIMALLVGAAFYYGLRRSGSPDAVAIWRRSVRIGEETPMRAVMSLTLWKGGYAVTTRARLVQGPQGRYRLVYEAPAAARGRVVYSDGKDHWQYEPRRDLLIKTAMAVRTEPEQDASLEQVERNYRIALVSEHATAAGRPVYLLELTPHHAGGTRERRWVDKSTFKTLRVERRYADDSLARLLSYEDVVLPARVSASEFQPERGPKTRVVSAPGTQNAQPVKALADRARSLGLYDDGPLGFRLKHVFISRVGKQSVTQLLYSDGLESLSIFVQKGVRSPSAIPPHWRRIRIGGMTAYQTTGGHTDTLTWMRGGRRYTVVSHLEPEALQTFVRVQGR
jgi:outer membrane lipoprotein-sorting protein